MQGNRNCKIFCFSLAWPSWSRLLAFWGLGKGSQDEGFEKTQISVKMKPYNPTSLHFILKSIKEILVIDDISLKFILLTISFIVVGFCRVCMEGVGFLYGFTPICRVLILFNKPTKNVKTLQTGVKPYTLYGVFLQNPTNPTGCENSRKPHYQRVFANHHLANVGM